MKIRIARDKLESFGIEDIELVAGSGGVFEIEIDGALRYSKKSLGRFPSDDELQALAAN